MKLDPNTLCSNVISKGSFGEIVSLDLKSNEAYALKRIKLNSDSEEAIDNGLREVMMAKIFSAL